LTVPSASSDQSAHAAVSPPWTAPCPCALSSSKQSVGGSTSFGASCDLEAWRGRRRRLGLVAPSGAGKTLFAARPGPAPIRCKPGTNSSAGAAAGVRGVCPAGARWCFISPAGPSPWGDRWRRNLRSPWSFQEAARAGGWRGASGSRIGWRPWGVIHRSWLRRERSQAAKLQLWRCCGPCSSIQSCCCLDEPTGLPGYGPPTERSLDGHPADRTGSAAEPARPRVLPQPWTVSTIQRFRQIRHPGASPRCATVRRRLMDALSDGNDLALSVPA